MNGACQAKAPELFFASENEPNLLTKMYPL
jgi:hypothetical protein